jgi:hypothetical protein
LHESAKRPLLLFDRVDLLLQARGLGFLQRLPTGACGRGSSSVALRGENASELRGRVARDFEMATTVGVLSSPRVLPGS